MREKMKILIGYDGSDCAEVALDDLKHAGLPAEAEAKVMSVAEVRLPPPPLSAYEIVEQANEVHVPADLKRVYGGDSAAVKEAEEIAVRACKRLQELFPHWLVTSQTSCGSPAFELVASADQLKPNLLVVGSHGRGAIGRFVLGSVSQRVLTEAHCSVRVARGRVEEADEPVRIVIGVDGSPPSELAVREVAVRAWPARSEIQLIIVDDPLVPAAVAKLIPPLTEVVDENYDEERHWAEELLDKYTALLSSSDLNVVRQIAHGDPKRVLVEQAEKWGADCIFVGSTGFSNRLERFVLGSVSAAIAAHAHCSVEVVRRPK